MELNGFGQFTLGEWAFAQISASAADPLRVLASNPSAAGGGRHDLVTLDMPRDLQPGASATVAVSCLGQQNCARVLMSFRLNPQGQSPEVPCRLDTGTVTVTTRSATRVKGTFSGTGACFVNGGVIENFQVTGGTFDVPVVAYS